MQKLVLLLSILFVGYSAQSQIRLASGLEYRLVKKGKGTKTAKPGDYISVVLKGVSSGATIFDTKTMNKPGQNLPVNFKVQKKQFNGDVIEVLALLHEGDSAVITIPQDSFYRMPVAQRPKNLRPGAPVMYYAGVHGIQTAAEFAKAQADYKKQMAEFNKQQAAFKKQQAEMAKQQKLQAALAKTQDKEIVKYLADNNITNAVKTASGLYVAIDEQGSGENAKVGYDITMNYDGKLLDGKKFDSNTDTAFHHVQPFNFKLGAHQVIAGWDEGIQQFKKGAKGKLIIPSGLAYGAAAQNNIPANSILRFDVELVDMKDPVALAKAEDDKIQEFLKANNVNATKTSSGLYYVITQPGSGENIKPGDNATMNYTGMFLDGKKFDSNIDSAFNHVSPFEFPLGQGRVIKGWDEGIAMFNKGAKGKLIIPSALGYGAAGNGSIPGGSILQFDVELVDFKKPTPPPAAAPASNSQQIQVGQKKN